MRRQQRRRSTFKEKTEEISPIFEVKEKTKQNKQKRQSRIKEERSKKRKAVQEEQLFLH
jgi:hypothetical protein